MVRKYNTYYPFVPEKNPNRENVIIVFIESWKEIGPWFWFIWIARGLFLIWVNFRGQIRVKVGPKTETLCTSLVSVKIQVFQNALNSICTNLRTTSDQNFSLIWCCLVELLPQTHQNGHNWVLNQKNVVLLPGKVENKKYTETESWLSANFW